MFLPELCIFVHKHKIGYTFFSIQLSPSNCARKKRRQLFNTTDEQGREGWRREEEAQLQYYSIPRSKPKRQATQKSKDGEERESWKRRSEGREKSRSWCTRFTVIQQTVCLTTILQCILQPPSLLVGICLLLLPSQLVGSVRSFPFLSLLFPLRFSTTYLSFSLSFGFTTSLLSLSLTLYVKCMYVYVCASGFASAYIRMAPVYRKKYPMKSRIHSSPSTTHHYYYFLLL